MMPEHFLDVQTGGSKINGFYLPEVVGNAAETEEGAVHPLA